MLALCHAVYGGPIAVYLEIAYQQSSSVWFEYCVGVTTCWSRWHAICWFISIIAYTGCPTNFVAIHRTLLGLIGLFWEREIFISIDQIVSQYGAIAEDWGNPKSFCLLYDSTQRTREPTWQEDISWTLQMCPWAGVRQISRQTNTPEWRYRQRYHSYCASFSTRRLPFLLQDCRTV